MSKQVLILVGIFVVVVGLGALLFVISPEPATPGVPAEGTEVVREHNRMTGQMDDKVVLVEFGDYQCPGCRNAHPIVKQVIDEYKDNPDFNFVYRNLPLTQIHPNAEEAAEAAETAGDMGKFWEMHDRLFQNQDEWANDLNPIPDFVRYATEIGLDATQFEEAVRNRTHRDAIATDVNDARELGISSTPTFMLNGQVISPQGFNDFKSRIDAELQK